jgi:hypothetical protein
MILIYLYTYIYLYMYIYLRLHYFVGVLLFSLDISYNAVLIDVYLCLSNVMYHMSDIHIYMYIHMYISYIYIHIEKCIHILHY